MGLHFFKWNCTASDAAALLQMQFTPSDAAALLQVELHTIRCSCNSSGGITHHQMQQHFFRWNCTPSDAAALLQVELHTIRCSCTSSDGIAHHQMQLHFFRNIVLTLKLYISRKILFNRKCLECDFTY